MDIPKQKILILGTPGSTVVTTPQQLGPKYQFEIASTPQMAEFLLQEWEPRVCLIEARDEFIQWIPRLRSLKGYHGVGVIVTGPASAQKEEQSFRLGCDHWFSEADSFEPLIWRINSLLRRPLSSSSPVSPSPDPSDSMIQISSLKIYPRDFLVKRMGQVVSISPTQFKLLNAFLNHPDQLLSREWIKNEVWSDSEISLRSIDAHISKLRKVLPELDPHLMNIYGKGYIFSQSRQEAA